MIEFIDFGEVIPELVITSFSSEMQRMYNASQDNENFEIIELRKKENCEIIIADCLNDQVPTRNKFGIKTRERIGIVYSPAENRPYDVRVLRKDFPAIIHQNFVPINEPKSICLYNLAWGSVERTWTPQQFLKRILWWFEKAAQGQLHTEEQPLEQIYYTGFFQLIVPPDFVIKSKDKNLKFVLNTSLKPDAKTTVLRGCFIEKNKPVDDTNLQLQVITINTTPILQSYIEYVPYTLGELHDQFINRNINLKSQIQDEIKQLVTEKGVDKDQKYYILLILIVPVKRDEFSSSEENKLLAFNINSNTAILGQACDVLFDGMDNKFYLIQDIVKHDTVSNENWRSLKIEPVDIPMCQDSCRLK